MNKNLYLSEPVKMFYYFRLPGTYAAKIDKIRPPLHVSRNNSFTRPYFKNVTGNVPGNLRANFQFSRATIEQPCSAV